MPNSFYTGWGGLAFLASPALTIFTTISYCAPRKKIAESNVRCKSDEPYLWTRISAFSTLYILDLAARRSEEEVFERS